jgi:hypothetical protein
MYSITPVGSVIAFAGKIAKAGENPQKFKTVVEATGWMACDGRQLQIAQYPQLFATIGYLYSEKEDEQHFNIPDYREYSIGLLNHSKTSSSDEQKTKTPPVTYIIKYK